MNRREFGKKSLLSAFALATASIWQAACTFSSVYSKILAYTPVALQAFANIVQILAGGGVISLPLSGTLAAIDTSIQSAFADITAAVNAYESAPATQKSSLLGKVSLALVTAENALNKFWSDLTIPQPQMASLIEGLLGVVVTALAGFAAQLPPAPKSARLATRKRISATAQLLTLKQFKSRFNTLVVSGGYPQYKLS